MDDFDLKENGEVSALGMPLQLCPKCREIIGAFPGGRDSLCRNCGYKDPCCE